jgi:hypothetical protein
VGGTFVRKCESGQQDGYGIVFSRLSGLRRHHLMLAGSLFGDYWRLVNSPPSAVFYVVLSAFKVLL